jgi:hypothetical protein
MALKLGELLLKEKMITPDQLDEGLKNQMIYGIRLGSSLIEMGYVDEHALANLLSKKLGVLCVDSKELASIPKEVIQKFPRDLVEKFHVVPFKLEGNRLSLAMSDPTDFTAIEEIGFITGYVVQPFIAPDVYISRALSSYYRVSLREVCYQQVADLWKKKRVSKPAEPVTISIPTFSETGELLNVTIPAEFEGFANMLDDEPEDMYLLSENVDKYTVDRLSLDFAAARSRDDVANVFINYLGQEFTTGALFIVRGNAAVGWRGVSGNEKIAGFGDVSVLLSKPSVLRDIIETRNYSMGALINTPENGQILKALHIRPETPLLVLPVIMLNKVVAAVLVSADMDSLGRRLVELQKLIRKASLAFEMLIIKNKILMT